MTGDLSTARHARDTRARAVGSNSRWLPAWPVPSPRTPPAANSLPRLTKPEAAHDGPDREPPADHAAPDRNFDTAVDLPDVAWISARDGSRAPGDLEDEAARYHPARHELTINADFRAITDLTAHWRARYRAVPGAQTVIEAHVREWCEQILVEVVLAARSSNWSPEQLEALLSPASLTAALLPRTCCTRRFRSASHRSSARRGATPADRQGTRGPHRNLFPGRAAAELRKRPSRRREGRRDESRHSEIGARQDSAEL